MTLTFFFRFICACFCCGESINKLSNLVWCFFIIKTWDYSTTKQGRREPNVGPRPAQILRISGFVNSKTDGENATVLSGFWCDLKKKRSRKNVTVFSRFWSDLKKKVFGLPHTDFSVSLRWAFWSPWPPSQRAPWWVPWSPWAPGSLSPLLLPSRRPCY